MMSEPIGCNEIVFCRMGCCLCNDLVYFLVVGIGEKYRFYIGIVYPDMFHPVFFFVAAGKFVFFDNTVEVIIDISAYDESVLCTSVHGLGVYVISFGRVLLQPSFFLKLLEVFYGFLIYFGIVFVGSRSKVYFGFNDMVKRLFVSCGFVPRFFRVENVVRTRCYLLYKFFWRSYSFERFYPCHEYVELWGISFFPNLVSLRLPIFIS